MAYGVKEMKRKRNQLVHSRRNVNEILPSYTDIRRPTQREDVVIGSWEAEARGPNASQAWHTELRK